MGAMPVMASTQPVLVPNPAGVAEPVQPIQAQVGQTGAVVTKQYPQWLIFLFAVGLAGLFFFVRKRFSTMWNKFFGGKTLPDDGAVVGAISDASEINASSTGISTGSKWSLRQDAARSPKFAFMKEDVNPFDEEHEYQATQQALAQQVLMQQALFQQSLQQQETAKGLGRGAGDPGTSPKRRVPAGGKGNGKGKKGSINLQQPQRRPPQVEYAEEDDDILPESEGGPTFFAEEDPNFLPVA